MRKRACRSGFTLVELLVVMSIIAILAAMLMPAVNAVREQARRTQCTNNMRNVALALVQHDANKGTLPGYREFIDKTNRSTSRWNRVSWVYPMLPYIERNDIYKAYGPNGPRFGTDPSEYLKILSCPNDGTSRSGTNMSYVVNTGVRGYDWKENPATAPFLRADYNDPSRDQRVPLSLISGGDGTAQTLMLSENVDAGKWIDHDERRIGFCYRERRGRQERYVMNWGGPGNKRNHPRASSYHAGGVVVSFCDPHVVFLSESIDPAVWRLLFTPNGMAAVYTQNRLLSEEDLGAL